MKVARSSTFKTQLKEILYHIAQDSPGNAKAFNRGISDTLLSLPNMPYKYRQSIYFDDQNIRDCIYKGYVIPYLIEENLITVIGIVKWRKEL